MRWAALVLAGVLAAGAVQAQETPELTADEAIILKQDAIIKDQRRRLAAAEAEIARLRALVDARDAHIADLGRWRLEEAEGSQRLLDAYKEEAAAYRRAARWKGAARWAKYVGIFAAGYVVADLGD